MSIIKMVQIFIFISKLPIVLTIAIILASCTVPIPIPIPPIPLMESKQDKLYGASAVRERTIPNVSEVKEQLGSSYVSYFKDVQPIFNRRCVSCHACYDAPCQLKLNSFEGLDRGASTRPVYNGLRFIAQKPTRLGIDATTTAQWRGKGFYPVLNERNQTAKNNLDNSLLYKMLTLKRRNPLPTDGRLPELYDVDTNFRSERTLQHQQQCGSVQKFDNFAKKHPEWGMPFAFPSISNEEFKTIKTWLEQGGRIESKPEKSDQQKAAIKKWERFFNGNSNKEQLMSRYIYEHLFLAHLHFDDLTEREYYTLVRSRTPPSEPIDIIASKLPYENPGVDRVYYRLKYYDRTIVSKTHLPYSLDDKKMERMRALFLDANYIVDKLPGYDEITSANPFKTFVEIPAKSRYKFMLDNAHFFINGFIKGPVCRGSIALSVIDDHFWVVFFDPDNSYVSSDSDFLARVSDNLRMPIEEENFAAPFSIWTKYSNIQQKYIEEKTKYLAKRHTGKHNFGINQIWNGNQKNTNAALTVYRHYDSATVLKGFVGEVPKTGWVIDYPILERIHYLLVAGFDVYGTLSHQLSTRLYMDFLRIESELYFLQFLPNEKRIEIHKNWYRGTKQTQKYIKMLAQYQAKPESSIKFETEDVKTEFFLKLHRYFKAAQKDVDYINLCTKHAAECEAAGIGKDATDIQESLRRLSALNGEVTDVFPDETLLRIVVDGTEKNDLVYSIVRNKSYLNTTSLTVSEKMRIHEEDTIDIVEGFVGAYPNFFLQIDMHELEQFIEQYVGIDNFEKYNAMIEQYGIRRTSPSFWSVSDFFNRKFQYDEPKHAGILDLSRYQNR